MAPVCAAVDTACPALFDRTAASAVIVGASGGAEMTVSTAAADVAVAVVPLSELVTTQSYVPASAAVTPFENDNVAPLAPWIGVPSRRHE